MPRIAKLCLIPLAVGVVALVVLFLAPSHLAPPPPLPNPNGYDTFVKAIRMLKDQNFEEAATNADELKRLVATNAPALAVARQGFDQQSAVPLRDDPNLPVDELSGMKRLASAFAAEGDLAKAEGRPADAARSYVDCVRLGVSSMKGGAMIHSLIGVALETIGNARLSKLYNQLDASTCRKTAEALEMADARREPFSDVLVREHEWSRRAFPGLRDRITAIVEYRTTRLVERTSESRIAARVLQGRRVILNLAARAYELEKGHPPNNAADLVPEYLESVPLDPITGTNLMVAP